MNRIEWIDSIKSAFFDVITTGGTLDDLADCAYNFLGNPIMIGNEQGEIFSKAKENRPYNDALWEEFDAKGYVPREKRHLISSEQYKSARKNDAVIIFNTAYVSHRLMFYQTKIGPSFVMRTLMLESKRPFSVDDKIVFGLFSKAVAYFLRDSKLVRSFNSSTLDFFLHELISGRIDSEKNEKDLFSYLDLRTDDRLFLLVARRLFEAPAPLNLYESRQKLQSIFNNSTTFIYDNNVVAFINIREQGTGLTSNLERAEAFLRKNSMHAAVSRYFESFHNISEVYRVTLDVLNMGIKIMQKDTLLFVGDFYVPYMLDTFDSESLKAFCYMPLLELMEIDKQEEGELVPSLYAYIITLGNISMSARLLGIHYNTMKYRLLRIGRVVGRQLDFILPALYISIKTLILTESEFMGKCFKLEQHYRKMRDKFFEYGKENH